jgi:hypothetical protein
MFDMLFSSFLILHSDLVVVAPSARTLAFQIFEPEFLAFEEKLFRLFSVSLTRPFSD